MEGFWLSCLSRLEKELPAQQFNTWIRPLKVDPAGPPAGEVRLLAPNRFVLQWVKERFAPRIEAMVAEYFDAPVRVTLGLDQFQSVAAAAAPAPPWAPNAGAPATRALTPRTDRKSVV